MPVPADSGKLFFDKLHSCGFAAGVELLILYAYKI
jgi:hypothetical protein